MVVCQLVMHVASKGSSSKRHRLEIWNSIIKREKQDRSRTHRVHNIRCTMDGMFDRLDKKSVKKLGLVGV